METPDEKWFRERLRHFLEIRHPPRQFHHVMIERRSRLAFESYAQSIKLGATAESAVRAADKQENIRIYRLYLVRIILIELEGVGLQHLCARTEACTLCSFRRQFRNEPACKHTKTARRAAGGVAFAKIKFSGHFFKL